MRPVEYSLGRKSRAALAVSPMCRRDPNLNASPIALTAVCHSLQPLILCNAQCSMCVTNDPGENQCAFL
jgi:hypothetical protein